jgi:AraC-like DNA-binding protein
MAPRKLRRAVEFMNDHLEREVEVSLPAVAEAVGMSYFHFSRAFKQSMGVSPNNYLVERRIERAKKLLAETDTPSSRSRCGWGSPARATSPPPSANSRARRRKLTGRCCDWGEGSRVPDQSDLVSASPCVGRHIIAFRKASRRFHRRCRLELTIDRAADP